jgi:hypothetical protein
MQPERLASRVACQNALPSARALRFAGNWRRVQSAAQAIGGSKSNPLFDRTHTYGSRRSGLASAGRGCTRQLAVSCFWPEPLRSCWHELITGTWMGSQIRIGGSGGGGEPAITQDSSHCQEGHLQVPRLVWPISAGYPGERRDLLLQHEGRHV